MPAPRKFDREAAFQFWYGQAVRPSLDVVAAEFGVSHQTMREAASQEDWRGRAEYLDAQVRAETDKRLARTAAERNADMLKIFDHVLALFTRRLALPQADPGALRPADLSVREMADLARVIQLLQGSPTDRHAVTSQHADHKSLEELEKEMEELWMYELEREALQADAEKRRSGEEGS